MTLRLSAAQYRALLDKETRPPSTSNKPPVKICPVCNEDVTGWHTAAGGTSTVCEPDGEGGINVYHLECIEREI